MKKLVALLFLLISTLAVAQKPSSGTALNSSNELSNGLVSALLFNGTTADQLAVATQGTSNVPAYSAFGTTDSSGDAAMWLNDNAGTAWQGGSVAYNAPTSVQPSGKSGFTVMAFVTSMDVGISEAMGTGNNEQDILQYGEGQTGGSTWNFGLAYNGHIGLFVSDLPDHYGSTITSQLGITSGPAFANNTWMVIGVSQQSGGAQTFFKDGYFEGGYSYAGSTVPYSQFYVGDGMWDEGAGQEDGGNSWFGKVSYILVWNRALNQAEMASIYANPYQMWTSSGTLFVLSTPVDVGGAVMGSLGAYTSGSTYSLTVTPSSGYSTVSVSGCSGTLSGSTYSGTMPGASCSVTATFARSGLKTNAFWFGGD